MKTFKQVLVFGFFSGLLWCLVPGFLANLFDTPAGAPATILAGVLAGVFTTAILAVVVAGFGRGFTVVIGTFSLPLGAFVFGFAFALIERCIPAMTSGTRAISDPWVLGFNYAVLSVVSIFAIGLVPMAIITTLLLRAFIRRESRSLNAA